MNLIKKIEFNYFIKIINELVSQNNFDDLIPELRKIFNKSPLLYYQILRNFYVPFKTLSNTQNLFFNNIIYVNSFMPEDTDIVYNFLNYYLKEINFDRVFFSNLPFELSKIEAMIRKKNNLNFDDIVENSTFYQIILSMQNQSTINVLKNEFAFFSSSTDLNFSDPNIVKCFFLIVDHPCHIFQKIKESNENDLTRSQNEMFNLDNSIKIEKYHNINVEIIKKGWNIHTSSWLDPNVLNSFKGMVIKKENLLSDPIEIYSSIILHLRQSGLDVKLNYEIIKRYISNSLIDQENRKYDLSNNEKKFLRKNTEKVISELEFII